MRAFRPRLMLPSPSGPPLYDLSCRRTLSPYQPPDQDVSSVKRRSLEFRECASQPKAHFFQGPCLIGPRPAHALRSGKHGQTLTLLVLDKATRLATGEIVCDLIHPHMRFPKEPEGDKEAGIEAHREVWRQP